MCVCGSVQSEGLDGSTKSLQLIVASDIMLMLSFSLIVSQAALPRLIVVFPLRVAMTTAMHMSSELFLYNGDRSGHHNLIEKQAHTHTLCMYDVVMLACLYVCNFSFCI